MLTRSRPMPRSRGFTLIELMVVVVIIAVTTGLAAPSFRLMLANYRVRGGAEGIVNGLNQARAEAVRRNTPVSFILSGTGSGWTVRQVTPATDLRKRGDGESAGITAVSSNASNSVTFLGTGLVDSTGTQLTQVTVASATNGADSRRINVFGGGLIRMCNPAISTAGDPRRC
jgi:type IV fimbrial biogenesis protein FimT